MSSSLSLRERGLLATAVLGGIVALGGVYVGTQAIEAEEKAYAVAAEKSADLKAAKSLAVELQRRLDKAEKRGEQPAGAPGTLAAQNRNPLNVKALGGGRKWKGQLSIDAKGHVVFDSLENGLRAGAHVLTSYYGRHGLDTIEGLVGRFCESNKAEYAAFLSKHMGLASGERFNVLARLPQLMRCMSRFESGNWLPERYFTGYDIASSAYAKGKESRPRATIVATAATKPAPKPAPKPQPQKAQPKPKPAPQKAQASHKQQQPRQVASK